MITKRNVFEPVDEADGHSEIFEEIIRTDNLLVERIVSHGQATPEGEWYDQDKDEWVILLSGRAILKFDTGETLEMGAGDHVFLRSHQRHRVEFTSKDPGCIWLALHGNL